MRFDETALMTTFDFFAGMAFRGTCVAMVALLFVLVLRKHIRPQIRYLLLILAFLRLALPVAPASGLSVFNVRPHTWFAAVDALGPARVVESQFEPNAVPPDKLADPVRALNSIPVVAVDSPVEEENQPSREKDIGESAAEVDWTQPPQPGALAAIANRDYLSWKTLLLAVSGLGTGLILSRSLIATSKWRAILARATKNAILQSCADQLLEELNIRRPVRVVMSKDCNQPGLYGLLRPVVILPSWCSELSTESVRLLLRHELTHLRRFDHWVFRLTQAVAAFHWWNPIVRRTLTQLRRECELACDQAVLKALPAKDRQQYGHLLLEVADRQIANRSNFTAIAFSPTALTLGERVNQTQNFSQSSWRSRLTAAVFVVSVAAFGLTDGLPLPVNADEAIGTTAAPKTPAPEVVNLKGHCVDQNGNAVPHVYVGVYGGRSTAEPVIKIAEGGTDKEGQFHIQGTLPELLREPSASPLQVVAVFWKRGGHATTMIEWTGEAIDDSLTVVTDTKVKRIQGRVINHLGNPVQGATVILPNRLYAAIPTSHYGLTNVEGQFNIPNLPSKLEAKTLWVAHPGFGQMEFRHSEALSDVRTAPPSVVDSPVGESGKLDGGDLANQVPFKTKAAAAAAPSSLLTITIPKPGGIEGKVIDSASQKPVSMCVVSAWSKDRKQFAQTQTNKRGEYQLRVFPGEYTLTVVAGKAELEVENRVTIEAGNTVTASAIKIRDERSTSPKRNTRVAWFTKKPDRIEVAAAKSREYQFGEGSDEVDAEAIRLLSVLKEQQDNHKTGSDEWAETMRSLINLGSAAVPQLCEDLDRTDQKDRSMLRSLPFILRGIGDTRAVPSLIRAIPRCFGRDGSDMGYRCEDPDLLSFMQKHDHGNRNALLGPDNDYSWGRPVNEVFPALKQLTGRGDGAFTLAHVSSRKSGRHNVLGQRLYNQSAVEWAAFWEENWNKFLDDEKFRLVNVKPVKTGEMPTVPSRDVPFKISSGESNGSLASVLSPSGHFVFRDLDTGLRGDLPEQFRKLSRDQRIEQMDRIIAWARKYGFDLMGSEVEHDGVSTYVIRAIDMEISEISKNDFDKPTSMNAMASRGRKIEKIIAHFDAAAEKYDYSAAGYFCFVTSEGVPGKMLLGVPITSTNLIAGFSDHTRNEFMHTGIYLGRRYALKWLKIGQ